MATGRRIQDVGPSRASIGRGPGARLVGGAALAAFGLWLAFRGTHLAALGEALAGLRVGWLLAAGGSVFLTLAAGMLRWRALLNNEIRWVPLADAFIIGQTLNILLPIRLGEVVRTYIATRAANIPVTRVITSIGIEKLADLIIAALAMGVLLTLVALPDWALAPGRALVMTGALATIAALFALWPRALSAMARLAIRAAPHRWHDRLERQFAHAAEALAELRNWKRALSIWTLSVAVFLLAASTNYLLFLAFDLRLPAIAAVTLLLSLQVGNSIASVPGNLGVFHYVTVLVLAAYGVPHDTALAYALVLYAIAIVPKIAIGSLRISMAYGWSSLTRLEART